MADPNDPTNALGTPDPSAIPPNLAAVPPTGDPTGIPGTLAAPAAGSDMPTPMGTTPGTEVPASTGDPEVDAGSVHQNWLSHILDTVGTILGGDKTIVATKHPDGSISVEHNPSTTGEKWGRVAQAALGGAARGMGVGQGPGGAGRAFAAGGLAGLQAPSQNLAAANAEAASMSAQQIANANHVLLDQAIIKAQYDNQEQPIEFRQKTALNSVSMAKTLEDMHATMVHHSNNFADLTAFGNANPLVMQGHGNGETIPVPQADGSFDIWQIPADEANQLVMTDVPYTSQDLDPQHNGKLIETPHVINGGTQSKSQILLTLKGVTDQNNKNIATSWTAQTAAQAAANKGETNPLALQVQLEHTTDPAERARLQAALDADQQRREVIAQKSRPVTNIATPGIGATPDGGTAYQPGRNPVLDDTAEGLASGRYLQSTLPKRTGKGQPTPQEQNYAANIISQQKYGLPYNPTIIDQENSFAKAPKTQAYLEGIDRMTGAHGDPGQLNQLLSLAQAAGIGGNAPLNDIKQAVRTRLGSEAADNFQTLLTETQSNLGTLIGNPLLGSGESDQKLRTAQSAFGQNPTLDSLRGQVATVTDVLNRSRSNMAANNRYIQQRYGNRLSPSAAPTATGGGAAATNTSQAARAPGAGGYQQGVNTPQFPIAQSADGKTRTQWNGTTWATLP